MGSPAPDVVAPPHAAESVDARRLVRLRWRARRGMLENDLILTRFLDRRGADLGESEIAALDRLLDLPDDALWEVICGRATADDALLPLVLELRKS